MKKVEHHDTAAIPRCVGVIMDGNRRWAREHGLPTFEGHRRGYEKIKYLLRWSKEADIREVIVYAFSSKNWLRPKKEVGAILDLFRMVMGDILEYARAENTRITFFGELERFPQDLQISMQRVSRETRSFSACHLGIALSYDGHQEILNAIYRIPPHARGTLSEGAFSKLLWTKDFTDPDMIIRTSGESRLSGFLPWQAVYSEFFFIDSYWPAFSKRQFKRIIEGFGKRQRNFGR
jgi:undecaprenyl diphosphate synthase